MKPKVSVIIPLYNKKDRILNSIQSVLSQTYEDLELLVVNDGSTDGSDELIFEIDDPRLRLVSQSNQGVSVARNLGVSCASTEWIAFLDADDLWMPDFLHVMMNHAKKIGNNVFMGSNQKFGDTGILLHPPNLKYGEKCYFDLCSGSSSAVNSSCNLIPKEIFNKSGGFHPNQRIFEDWTLWMKIGAVCNFFYVNEVLSVYTHGGDDSASRIKRPVSELAKDIRTFLDAGDAILANPIVLASTKLKIIRYLTRVILESSCPYLLINNGRKEAFELLRRINYNHVNRSDFPYILFITRRLIKSFFR